MIYSSEMYLDRKYSYRRTLPHITNHNRPVFVTFGTFKRWELPAQARQLVLDCCLHERAATVDLHAAVVMSTHAHLLFTPLRNAEGWPVSLPQVMRLIKGRSAHFINRLLDRHGPVWQEESFDHVLRSNESLSEKVNYICQNPVRAGLVGHEGDYPWLWRGEVPILSAFLARVVTGLRPVSGAKPRHHKSIVVSDLPQKILLLFSGPLSGCNSADSPQTRARTVSSKSGCRAAPAIRDRARIESISRSPASA